MAQATRIRQLPAGLANQIAAGEVVERPASAVKELVENALDAGATRIAVAIEFGGKRLIRVEDDGEGMTSADAVLAVERHATSKIRTPDDLAAIATLGFRGEALPSIASVSHFRLRTRARGEASGTEVRVDGGGKPEATETGAPEGTLVEVRDLFYNVPARRKFLKSDGAETTHISRAMTQVALGYVGVGFLLKSGNRTLIDCPPASDFDERFFQIYGERPDLVPVRKQAGGVRLTGLAAALAEEGSTRGPQHLWVNRRAVKDKTILHAVNEGYRRATIKPRSPEVHLFIELPPDRVDVNVHPAKAEVRFLEQSLVHEVVRRGMLEALGGDAVPTLSLEPPGAPAPEPRDRSIPGIVSTLGAGGGWKPAAGGSRGPGGASVAHDRADAASGAPGGRRQDAVESAAVSPTVTWRPAGMEAGGAETAPLIPLGQFRDTFIVAVDNDGVVLIDQHVAHERILYEQVKERLTSGRLESQRLLEPLLMDLPPGAREALAAHAAELDRLGFEIEPFGGDSIRVAAVPALFDRAACEATVRALANDLEGFERGANVEDAISRIAATTACHAAVKAHDTLTREKMTWILQELRRTSYSTVCPHGRPVLLRIPRLEIERRFERI
ncbi:MAG: DNA mismatch repair endonuclease MutL [Acidobacteria bacterium]|nr:DNA mismatch repair endonuclease MutL [Acidobacteriota bacterium]MYD69172.1 DNA mismatch repair endonuclease MutL [Acidobacteriota bacterium]MYJ06193.1 DNA mismatch repair endonuclease MutL [Acidobacteriota bacterium]